MPDNRLSSGAPKARLHLEMDPRLDLLWRFPNLSSSGRLVIMTIGEHSQLKQGAGTAMPEHEQSNHVHYSQSVASRKLN